METNKPDIRITDDFKEYLKWELNNNIMHYKSEELERNLNVFIEYLGAVQKLEKTTMLEIGNKYNISKERVRQIFNKYLTHYIAFLFHMYGFSPYHTTVKELLSYLSSNNRTKIMDYFCIGKPFNYLTYKEISMLNYRSKMSLG